MNNTRIIEYCEIRYYHVKSNHMEFYDTAVITDVTMQSKNVSRNHLHHTFMSARFWDLIYQGIYVVIR
jgi:hypothetical protein